MNDFITILFLIISLGSLCLFAKTFFAWTFGMENYSLHKKRMDQLKFKNNSKNKINNDTKKFIEKMTNPVQIHVLPKIKQKKTKKQIEKDLKLIGWDKYFTPITFRAFDLTLKIIAIFVSILLFPLLEIMAVIWGVVLFFAFKFYFNNQINVKKEKLFKEFPDFIRITQGYLTAGLPFSECVEKTINFVGEEWKPLLQSFAITCRVDSIEVALENLKNEVDIFEVKELISLIKLNLEQGIEIEETFDRQADKVRDLQLSVIYKQINKRQTLAILVQGPLLLCMLATFALPTVNQMLNMGL